MLWLIWAEEGLRHGTAELHGGSHGGAQSKGEGAGSGKASEGVSQAPWPLLTVRNDTWARGEDMVGAWRTRTGRAASSGAI
jgi:hypothetical protein